MSIKINNLICSKNKFYEIYFSRNENIKICEGLKLEASVECNKQESRKIRQESRKTFKVYRSMFQNFSKMTKFISFHC